MIYCEKVPILKGKKNSGDVVTFTLGNEKFTVDMPTAERIYQIPYAIDLALLRGEKIMFGFTTGREWFNSRFVSITPLRHGQCRYLSKLAEYFDIQKGVESFAFDDAHVAEYHKELLQSVPEPIQEVWSMLDWAAPDMRMKQIQNINHIIALNEAFEYLIGVDTKPFITHPFIMWGYSYQVIYDAMVRDGVVKIPSAPEYQSIYNAYLAEFLQNIDYAAKIALDSTGPVSMTQATPSGECVILFQCVPITQSETALRITLPHGYELYYRNARIEGNDIKRGKNLKLSKNVLAKDIVTGVSWCIANARLYNQITGKHLFN